MLSTVMFHINYFDEILRSHDIKVPNVYISNSIDIEVPFNRYPHANVFLKVHLGSVIDIESLDSNAEIIKSLSIEELKTISMIELLGYGLQMGNSNYII
jgi:hypothetical protein